MSARVYLQSYAGVSTPFTHVNEENDSINRDGTK